MRPPSVYANPAGPAGDSCDLLSLLHGPHRVAYRLGMILLSRHGQSAGAVAGLLGCDPATVRRWVHRYNTRGVSGLGDRPRAGRPRLGSPGFTSVSTPGCPRPTTPRGPSPGRRTSPAAAGPACGSWSGARYGRCSSSTP